MKITLTSIALVLLMGTTVLGQKKSAPAKPAPLKNVSNASIIQAKIRKAWADYKNKDKAAFAAVLADGFAEVTNDSDGIFGKVEELTEIDHFNLSNYELKDFKLRPVGNTGALMTYTADYSGTYENVPMNLKTIYGEVWVKPSGEWKLLWVQETKVK